MTINRGDHWLSQIVGLMDLHIYIYIYINREKERRINLKEYHAPDNINEIEQDSSYHHSVLEK